MILYLGHINELSLSQTESKAEGIVRLFKDMVGETVLLVATAQTFKSVDIICE